MNRLLGKVAVITGGTRGIGLALAQAYAAEGASVFVASRSKDSLEEALSLLHSAGYQAGGTTTDVADLKQVQALLAAAVREFGRLDIWVNNAGVAGPYGPTIQVDPERFLQVVQTNILGVYYGSMVAAKHFMDQGHGKLINLLGYGAKGAAPYQNAYGSSKAWVRRFTQSLARETRDSGMGVYAFSPGMVLTDLLTNVEVIQGSEERLKNFPFVLRILAKPPEAVTEKAVWLASSATDGKTGLEIFTASSGRMMFGALRESLRSLFKQPATPIELNMKIIPPQNNL
jgi:NAD(P)-dependent dehydrogenase (short-subunit alcohol dehydrogenase family)